MTGSNRAILGLGTATLMPEYGLGAASIDKSEKLYILQAAVGNGVSYIDTAAAYGESENLLGELRDLLRAYNVRVGTKIAIDSTNPNSDALLQELEASLRRLRADTVDSLLLHSAKKGVLVNPAVAEVFGRVRRDGRVCLIGASTYGLDDAHTAIQLGWCDVIQVEYSILNQSVVRAILPLLREGQELVVRSVLCKGLLTGRRQNAPTLLRELGSLIGRLEGIAASWGYTLPELAIRFALDTPRVNIVLVGVSSIEELNAVLCARDREPLTAEQMRILETFDRSEMDSVHPERWENISV